MWFRSINTNNQLQWTTKTRIHCFHPYFLRTLQSGFTTISHNIAQVQSYHTLAYGQVRVVLPPSKGVNGREKNFSLVPHLNTCTRLHPLGHGNSSYRNTCFTLQALFPTSPRYLCYSLEACVI